ncbi:glycosyltransferase family 2 protein [Leifsonia flava]|uniref:Glycosyltransferase n=1 Tax=Orlajensenia leifsoniae TaxID=2561933 RepID=A0A4Y9R6R4_9MICO|nr:glycosyltransferase [Leifsonia flava]TFV99818.1 glycosyltransferase [Leifsonia flava]
MSARYDPDRGLPGNRWDLLDGLTPATPPSISVIVAHYEQPEQLARTLHALERQDHAHAAVEIIVVDDGSAEAPRVPPHVRLITQDDRGFRLAAARNLGAAAAENDVLVFLDADTSPEPTYLRAITRLPALNWDCVTVGHRLHADLGDAPVGAAIEVIGPERSLPEPKWLLDAYSESEDLLKVDHRSYRFVVGAVIACTRRFFDETGGFDESFTAYGGEDWEWAYRAWLNGAVLAHVPDAVAWHDGPDQAGRESADVAAKNEETLRLSDLIPVPGSRGRGIRSGRVDVAVFGPPDQASAGQRFVSVDSVLAELPGAGIAPPTDVESERFDRVRIDVTIEAPVRVHPGGLVDAVDAVDSGRVAAVAVCDPDGTPLVRLTSRRERTRQARWPRAERLPTLELRSSAVERIVDEVDVEAYLGGW